MAERDINPILKQVLELGPTVVFFIIYRLYCCYADFCADPAGRHGRTLVPDGKAKPDADVHCVYGDLLWWSDCLL